MKKSLADPHWAGRIARFYGNAFSSRCYHYSSGCEIAFERKLLVGWQQERHKPSNVLFQSLSLEPMSILSTINGRETRSKRTASSITHRDLDRGKILWRPCTRCAASTKRRLSTANALASSSCSANDPGNSENDQPTDAKSPGLKLYNTMTESLEEIPSVSLATATESSEEDGASTKQLGLGWYTCGPTTYAPAHLGHARTYVCLDILRRVMAAQRRNRITTKQSSASFDPDHPTTAPTTTTNSIPEPLFVLNITDVDDKTLAAAMEVGTDPLLLARKFEREFWRDWDSLNCLRPHIVTRVTEHVDSHIVPFIEGLVERGMAYELEGGDQDGGNGVPGGVYFDVRAYNERMGHLTRYGKLAPSNAARGMDDILLGNSRRNNDNKGINPDPPDSMNTKRDPRDFVLWKTRKKGTEALSWSSPWGDGRPGWHIECSAMIEAVQERFRDSHRFLVHAGGIDLKFPHHTNEIAQSEAYLGVGEWIPHWVHTGHLHIDGLKMSKSLKNFVSIRDFLTGRVSNNGDDDDDDNDDENEHTFTENESFQGALESPSDDFRLWCLGLSGSYRGPATFSMKRIEEARSVRHKILRFLVEGEAWVHTIENEQDESIGSTKKWNDEECDLFRTTDRAKRLALSALENDLDGSTFLSNVLVITECGMKFMASKGSKGPAEPMVFSIREVRYLLRLVGFTETTTEAGVRSGDSPIRSARVSEEALVDSLVQFRSAVRSIALGDPSASGMKELLVLSDELRDKVLPEIGVQLMDSNSEKTDTKENSETSWKFCLPRRSSANDVDHAGPGTGDARTETVVNLSSVPIADFFRVGQYEGAFSEYTEDGIPTRHSDGSEISKRLLKKLLKKREKHRLRLEKNKTA